MLSVVISGSGGWGCSMVVGVGSREVGWGVQVTVASGGWGCCHIVNFVFTPSQ